MEYALAESRQYKGYTCICCRRKGEYSEHSRTEVINSRASCVKDHKVTATQEAKYWSHNIVLITKGAAFHSISFPSSTQYLRTLTDVGQ